MDAKLVGFWKVVSVDMVVGRAVRIIAGLPNEIVEFAENDLYRVWYEHEDPSDYCCQFLALPDVKAIDIWVGSLPDLRSKCIYCIDGDVLTICIAGDSGERPTAVRRDDQRLWCLKTFTRCDRPNFKPRRRRRRLLRPGSLIPDGLFWPSAEE